MLKMEFTFDKAAIEKKGYSMESLYGEIKKEFASKNIPCVSDNEVLAFSGTGHKDDFSNMLTIMRIYSQVDWFMDTASSWIFRTNEGWEDVLKQAKKDWEEGRRYASKHRAGA